MRHAYPVGILSAIRGDNGSSVGIDPSQLRAAVVEAALESDNQALFQERIAELEFQLEDINWTRLAGVDEKFEFSRANLKTLIKTSRLYYLKNPVIRRPVELQAYYVWGQGVSIRAGDGFNEVVEGFMDDPGNKQTFTSHEAMMQNERKLRVEGNFFLRFFPNEQTGRLLVRRLNVDEIAEVITNPEDSEEVWFYLRKHSVRTKDGSEDRVVLYPDYRYVRQLDVDGEKRPGTDALIMDSYDNVSIDWSTPVMHRKTGGFSDMAFGIPETYAAIDWARAYRELLEDHKKTVRSLAKWAWRLKSGGGAAQLAAAKSSLESTLGASGSFDETNPAPVGGSVFAYAGDTDLRAVDVSKATIDPEGFRRALLMAATAMGMSDNFYGDSSSGNLASAKTLDRPMELMFRDRQEMWADIFGEVLMYACEVAAKAPGRSGISSDGYDEYTGKMKFGGGEDPDITIEFPPILQRSVQEQMQAIVSAITLNGQPIQVLDDGPTVIRMMCEALGLDDIESVVEVFYPSDDSEPTAKKIRSFPPPPTPEEKQIADLERVKGEVDKARADFDLQQKLPPANNPGFPPAAPRSAPAGKPAQSSSTESAAGTSDADIRAAQIEFMAALVELRAAKKVTNQ